MELDAILEQERRQQSLQTFQNASDQKMDKYMQSLDVPNNKNVSRGMQGVFGSSGGGDTGGGYGGNQGYGGPGG